MATETTNYHLKKPDYTDTADIKDINDNMEAIDTAMADLQTDVDKTVKFTSQSLTVQQKTQARGNIDAPDQFMTTGTITKGSSIPGAGTITSYACRRVGNTIFASAAVTASLSALSSSKILFNIPSGYKPNVDTVVAGEILFSGNSFYVPAWFKVKTDGSVVPFDSFSGYTTTAIRFCGSWSAK